MYLYLYVVLGILLFGSLREGIQQSGHAGGCLVGNYFDTPIRMDGVLHKMPNGRIDSIMRPIFGASHASNLLELPDGTLLLVWFSGGDEGGDGVGIVSSTLPPGAVQWTKPILASSERMRSAQNPVTFYEPSENVVRLLHTSQVMHGS
jgi:predicted neuraminidase